MVLHTVHSALFSPSPLADRCLIGPALPVTRRVTFALMATATGLVPFGLVAANAGTVGWTATANATAIGKAAGTFPVTATLGSNNTVTLPL
jgi:hypothetical protein